MDDNAMQNVAELLNNVKDEFLRTKPMWMRLNYMASMVGKAIEDGHSESEINWNYINEVLADNVDPYDFNCFGKIASVDDLMQAAMDSKTASLIGAWQQHVCKDCGKVFYMSRDEVKFFEGKNLNIPKRCKSCRNKRKAGK